MAQWINTFWNNGFVNPMRLPLLCEKTGALAIVELGLAGRQAGGRVGGQAGRRAGREAGRHAVRHAVRQRNLL